MFCNNQEPPPHSFKTAIEAQQFVRDKVDVHIPQQRDVIGGHIVLNTSTQELGGGRFTNIYDVSYRVGEATPGVHVHDRLTGAYDSLRSNDIHKVATVGGFFFLADQASSSPRQLALNLAAANDGIHSLPVADKEAATLERNKLSAKHVRALGWLCINGKELSWSGSLTDHATDAKVFGNGNAVITHKKSDATGAIRVLDESSRFTPSMQSEDMVDIGFIKRGDGSFMGVSSSKKGLLDIFVHDIVVRCPRRYLTKDPVLNVRTIDSITLDSLQAALSVGPMLEMINFEEHPINKDASLGDKPPLLERPLARMTLYETEGNMVHFRLFDGRPGSERFTGVTPTEAVELIKSEGNIVWGCFLDSGQTAKLCVDKPSGIASFGNRHYLKWPERPGERYIWTPEIGRPTASTITLQ